MKPLILAALFVGSLSGCTNIPLTSIPVSPASIAQHTVADETAMRLAESAYKAERIALDFAFDNRILTGQNALLAKGFDDKAYRALEIGRLAYSAFNRDNFFSAVSDMQAAISDGVTLMQRK